MSVAFYPRTGVVLYASEQAAVKAAVGAPLTLSVSFVVFRTTPDRCRFGVAKYYVGTAGLFANSSLCAWESYLRAALVLCEKALAPHPLGQLRLPNVGSAV